MLRVSPLIVSISVARPSLPAHAASPRVLQGAHSEDIDRHVEACTDFYEFANGRWRSENPIPARASRWSRRVAAHDGNWHRSQSVLEEVSRRTDWAKGSIEQQVGDHYAACMNETAVNAAALKPLAAFLTDI